MPRHNLVRCAVCRGEIKFDARGRVTSAGLGKVVLTGREKPTAHSQLGNGAGKITREIICVDCGHVGWTNRAFNGDGGRGTGREIPTHMIATPQEIRWVEQLYSKPPAPTWRGTRKRKFVPEALVSLRQQRNQETP